MTNMKLICYLLRQNNQQNYQSADRKRGVAIVAVSTDFPNLPQYFSVVLALDVYQSFQCLTYDRRSGFLGMPLEQIIK
jgi:hypothetical protein